MSSKARYGGRGSSSKDSGGESKASPSTGRSERHASSSKDRERGDEKPLDKRKGGEKEDGRVSSKRHDRPDSSKHSKGSSSKGGRSRNFEETSEKRRAEKQKREAEEAARLEQQKKEEEERAKREEERRLEEEKRQREEEEQRKKEEEERQVKELEEDIIRRAQQKLAQRQANVSAEDKRPDESFYRTLDSSVKKNTAFVKKLRSLTEQQRDSLSAEFASLNLSKYIQEAVNSFAEAKLKIADVPCAVHLCGLFHQRYADFSKLLLPAIEKVFADGVSKDEKPSNVTQYRATLRLLGELVIGGVFGQPGINVLLQTFTHIVHNDKEHTYLPVILTFCRHCGEDLAGILPRKQRLLLDKYKVTTPKSELLAAEKQTVFRSLFTHYYNGLAKHLVSALKSVQKLERRNRHTLHTKGEVSAERVEEVETLRKAHEKLLSNTSTMADMLDHDMPDLPEDDYQEEVTEIPGINGVKLGEDERSNFLWEDEDTRTFYENIIDLVSFVPGILYKESSKAEAGAEAAESNGASTMDSKEDAAQEEQLLAEAESEASIEAMMEELSLKEQEPVVLEEIVEQPTTSAGASVAALLDGLLQRLPNCINRDLIDEAATEFCMKMNTKANRRRLIRALFTVNRNRLDLLPFYARFVATLQPCLPDIGTELVTCLLKDFRFQVFKKDQVNIESKIKNVRYIGELTKFAVCSKSDALHCLKILLHDFAHHSIEMACQLLETCGRFLFRSPESHIRAKLLLDTMMRKKSALHLDGRQNAMIDNAFFYCNPPEVQKAARKVRPPMQEYMRKALYKDLNRHSIEKVLRQMRKFPWDDKELFLYGVRCFSRVWKVKFNNVHCLANVLAGLVAFQEEIGIRVVDTVLEEIRIGMELNQDRYNQRRISVVKYLGELYNYRMVESSVLFRTLYLLLSFGHNADGTPSHLDAPDNYFRVRLICVLLDTCGHYFKHGSGKRRLDNYITFFQCYLFYKQQPIPLEIEYAVSDTLESLRSDLKRFTTQEEATEAASQLEAEFQGRRRELLGDDKSDKTSGGAVGQPMGSVNGQGGFQDDDEAEDYGDDGTDTEPERDPLDGLDDDAAEFTEEEMMNGDVDEEDEEVILRSGPKHIQCTEDDDFLSEFDRMMSDAVVTRRSDAPKVPSLDVAVPVRSGKLGDLEDGEDINFVLMLRKGHKPVFKDLNVPIDSRIAANIREKQEAEREEKREMKRLVLDYELRQEEEEYSLAMGELQRPVQRAVYPSRHSSGGRHHRGGGGGGGGDRRPVYMHRGPPAPSSIDGSPFPQTGPRRH